MASDSLNKLEEWKTKMIEKKKQSISVVSHPLQLLPLPAGFDPTALNLQPDKQIMQGEPRDVKNTSGLLEKEGVSKKEKILLMTPEKEQGKVQPSIQVQKEVKKQGDILCPVAEKSIAEEPNEEQRVDKLTRYLLKNVDKLKQVVINIEGSLRGVEYIRKRMKQDKLFHKKIKEKIERLRKKTV